MCLPRIKNRRPLGVVFVKLDSDTPQIQTFLWISFTKLWACLWTIEKPIYKADIVVIVLEANLGVSEFSLSNLFASLKV